MKIAVVIFNMGGPDAPEHVQPFLFNLFNDERIIPLFTPIRWCVAGIIAGLRSRKVEKLYELMGGKSPLLEQTEKQAFALSQELNKDVFNDYKVFVGMRYWDPMVEEVVPEIQSYEPDLVLLVPLYPQYSITTTESFLVDWARNAINRLKMPIRPVCCYYKDENFIYAHIQQIKSVYKEGDLLVFSAHGIPKYLVKRGDPYEMQVRHSVLSIVNRMRIPEEDYVLCYQSKFGFLPWLTPSLKKVMIKASAEGRNVTVVPISFVSEHIETLVELDIEYGEKLRKRYPIKEFRRVPALNCADAFIKCLAKQVYDILDNNGCVPHSERCVRSNKHCPHNVFRILPIRETAEAAKQRIEEEKIPYYIKSKLRKRIEKRRKAEEKEARKREAERKEEERKEAEREEAEKKDAA